MDKTIRILTYLLITTILLIFIVGMTGGFTFPKLLTAYILTFIIISITLFAKPVSLHINNLFIKSILIFLFVSGLSVIFSISPRISLEGCILRNDGYIFQWVCIILFFVIVGFFKRQHVIILIDVIVYTAVLIATYGIFQHFSMDFIIWKRPLNGASISTLGNPCFYSAFIATVIPLVLYKILVQSKYYLPLLPFFIVALYWGYTRAAVIAFVVSIIFFAVFSYKQIKKQKVLMYVIIVMIILASTAPLFTKRKSVYSKFAGISRFIPRVGTWKVGLEIIKDYPILGVGPDNIRSVWCSYHSPLSKCRPYITDGASEINAYQSHNAMRHQLHSRLHNDFLDVQANKGAVGLISYIFLLTCYFKMSWRRCKEQDILTVSIVTSVVAYLVQNQFAFGVIPQIVLWWYLMAMTFVVCKNEK